MTDTPKAPHAPSSLSQASVAQDAYERYVFGTSVRVMEQSGWEYTRLGTQWTRRVFVETGLEDDTNTSCTMLHFCVRFAHTSASTTLLEAYALDSKGQSWGYLPDPTEETAEDPLPAPREHDPQEVVVNLADGRTLRSGVYDPAAPDALTSGEYVRICDPNGVETNYWDKDEWATDPALVMGAIMNVAAGVS